MCGGIKANERGIMLISKAGGQDMDALGNRGKKKSENLTVKLLELNGG